MIELRLGARAAVDLGGPTDSHNARSQPAAQPGRRRRGSGAAWRAPDDIDAIVDATL